MDLATVLCLAQTILAAIQTLDKLRDTFSFSHYEKELQRLRKTVNAVQSVLEDADAKHGALNRQQINYIEDLKAAVYDANDVLDEFVTIVKRKELNEANHKLSNKVKSYLSYFTPLTHNLFHKVKDVNEKLDAIASNSSKFLFKVDHKPTMFMKQETSSFMSPTDTIIGRGEDLEKIIGMLLDSDDANVSSLAIVGMGGLGKTAFAQLVYNDPRVTQAFQLKSWTCIADQNHWNLTDILGKIMKELNVYNDGSSSLEQTYQKLGRKLGGKKYLLVLDDVWTESYHKWQELEKFLSVGKGGSRIVVTTRSKKTAQNIGGVRVHELQGLSDDDAWCLFKRLAFPPEQRENPDEGLVKLGIEIVKKCINVPLAIRVVGSLLRGESEYKWLSFRDKKLANINESDDTINSILSLSYNQLDFSLKSCFAYCAIFPKNFVIYKQMLISHWMAQGYINQECVGEEYIRTLLQRCLFQEVRDEYTGFVFDAVFKIHDLLHDTAEQVAGHEICRLNRHSLNVDEKLRHIALFHDFCPQRTFNKAHIRTCYQVKKTSWLESGRELSNSDKLLVGNSIAKWKRLRSLDLGCFGAESLPEEIGKLFHLRYLDISWSDNLLVLPNSIIKLVNLQTLVLLGCRRLKELPKDIHKLIDLTTLYIPYCWSLTHMPSNLGLLSNLHSLGLFVVGGKSSCEKQCFDGLEILRSMNNLKGFLQIRIMVAQRANYIKDDYGGGDYLVNKEHLSKIVIEFKRSVSSDHESIEWEQSLLEDMQPHVNIKDLCLRDYIGETIPPWSGREDNLTSHFYFPYLVNLEIMECLKLRSLPSLEKLSNLTRLILSRLLHVEYVVNANLGVPSLGERSSFFPCLKELTIKDLPKLKGWWPCKTFF